MILAGRLPGGVRTYMRILLLCNLLLVGCAVPGVSYLQMGSGDHFELSLTAGFDAAAFRDRLASLPRDSGWAFSYRRTASLVSALDTSGWPGQSATHDVSEDLQRAVAQALYDAARRPEWAHRHDQATTVAAVAEDLGRLCGIEKHVWMEVIFPLLDWWSLDLGPATARGMAVGSEIFVPEGGGATASFASVGVFLRTPRGRRDLFTEEYRAFLHGMLAQNALATANFLYQGYPAESRRLEEPRRLLLELEYLLHRRRYESAGINDEQAARAARAAPASDAIVDIICQLARSGGRPGEALALYYYGGQPGFEGDPRIRQALEESGSHYAIERLAEMAE